LRIASKLVGSTDVKCSLLFGIFSENQGFEDHWECDQEYSEFAICTGNEGDLADIWFGGLFGKGDWGISDNDNL